METLGATPGLGFNDKRPEQPEQTNSTITCNDQNLEKVEEQLLDLGQRHMAPDTV